MEKKKKELFLHRFNWKNNGKFIALAFEVTAFDLNNQKTVYFTLFPFVLSGSGYCMRSIDTHIRKRQRKKMENDFGFDKKKKKHQIA